MGFRGSIRNSVSLQTETGYLRRVCLTGGVRVLISEDKASGLWQPGEQSIASRDAHPPARGSWCYPGKRVSGAGGRSAERCRHPAVCERGTGRGAGASRTPQTAPYRATGRFTDTRPGSQRRDAEGWYGRRRRREPEGPTGRSQTSPRPRADTLNPPQVHATREGRTCGTKRQQWVYLGHAMPTGPADTRGVHARSRGVGQGRH